METKTTNLKAFVLDNINFDSFGLENKDLIDTGLTLFREESTDRINNLGEKDAFIGYLRALPKWLFIPFYYEDIRNLLYSLGYEIKQLDNDKLESMYYNLIKEVFLPTKITPINYEED